MAAGEIRCYCGEANRISGMAEGEMRKRFGKSVGLARFLAVCVASGICFCGIVPAARAEDALERQMKSAMAKALIRQITGTKEEARQECEAARKLLPATAPKYLSAYVEACFGLTASESGPQKKPESCPYFQRAVEIWRDNPPPAENDEIAMSHAQMLKGWKDSVAEDCPSTGTAPAVSAGSAKFTPIVMPGGATVETLENISYVMPGGWTIDHFNPTGGGAYFKNSALEYNLAVYRSAANETGNYPEKEKLGSGRILEWEYTSFVGGGKHYMFFARVKFDAADVSIGMTSSGSSEAGVDKATALEIVRKIAETLRVLGPRRCIADCGPGTITPAK
jgi:hypothetical protein